MGGGGGDENNDGILPIFLRKREQTTGFCGVVCTNVISQFIIGMNEMLSLGHYCIAERNGILFDHISREGSAKVVFGCK